VIGLQVARVALRDMPSRVLLGPLSGQAPCGAQPAQAPCSFAGPHRERPVIGPWPGSSRQLRIQPLRRLDHLWQSSQVLSVPDLGSPRSRTLPHAIGLQRPSGRRPKDLSLHSIMFDLALNDRISLLQVMLLYVINHVGFSSETAQ
jgi:hypothetical protein